MGAEGHFIAILPHIFLFKRCFIKKNDLRYVVCHSNLCNGMYEKALTLIFLDNLECSLIKSRDKIS